MHLGKRGESHAVLSILPYYYDHVNGTHTRKPIEERSAGDDPTAGVGDVISTEPSRRGQSKYSSSATRMLSAACIACVLSLCTILPFGAAAIDEGCEPDKLGLAYQSDLAPYVPTTDTAIVHLKLGGHDFYVPKNYFRHPPIGCGAEERAMLLRVLLPDLKPYSDETAGEYAAQRGHGKKMNILISRKSERIPLDALLQTFLDEGSARPGSDETFGLSLGRYRGKDDLYFLRSETETEVVILCWKVGPGQSASCDHHFDSSGQNVEVTYSRQYLQNWKHIQQAVGELIARFGAQPEN